MAPLLRISALLMGLVSVLGQKNAESMTLTTFTTQMTLEPSSTAVSTTVTTNAEPPSDPTPTSLAPELLVPITWSGVLEDGGKEVEVTGDTLEEIEAQVNAMNPDYTIFETNPSRTPAQSPNGHSVGENMVCFQPYGACGQTPIREGIRYLRGIKGNAVVPPGWGFCSRVSCSYDSGIWICNDNNHRVSVPFAEIGNVAERIVNQCSWWHDGIAPRYKTEGQCFNHDGWNVIVGYMRTC